MATVAAPYNPALSVLPRNAVYIFASAVVLLSGLVDLPSYIPLGPASAQAALSVAYFCAALILLPTLPMIGRPFCSRTTPLSLFVFWAIVSLSWTSALGNGLQNVLVIATFLVLIWLAEAGAAAVPGFAAGLYARVNQGAFLAAALYSVTLLIYGSGNNDVLGARSFGLFMIFGVAYHLAAWRYGSRSSLLWAIGFTVLIGASLSRLALGIAVLLFPLSQLPTRNLLRTIRLVIVAALVLALSYGAFVYFDVLRDRFLIGDVSVKIGSVGINVSGRTAFWRVTYESMLDAPIAGKGAGANEGLIENVFLDIRHPHSDYMRIAHDYGIIGAVLWAIAMITLVRSTWRAWRSSDRQRSRYAQMYLATFLSLCAFILEMTMENAMVYIFVLAPLAVMVGISLGTDRLINFANPRRS
jgi:O-antigen ligase